MSDSRPAVVACAWAFVVLAAAALGGWLLLNSDGARSAWLLLLVAFVLIAWAVFLFIALSRDPSRRSVRRRPGKVVTTHTLSFTVGQDEKHVVDFAFDQMWGWLTIAVDRAVIIKKFITFSLHLRRTFEFTVGNVERHAIRIEKSRPLFASFARPQPTRAFCDGVLVAEDDGIS
ncbi:hypothetical protein ACF1AJ_09365 [Leifsonia sp. NPDC014704]|uniref:hypothetical protein n=1 Tax=Leifsonia sp. NPDC014704 TaxID=3364123 RepID=UPI0036F46618